MRVISFPAHFDDQTCDHLQTCLEMPLASKRLVEKDFCQAMLEWVCSIRRLAWAAKFCASESAALQSLYIFAGHAQTQSA